MSIEESKTFGNRFIEIFNENNTAIADEIFATGFKASVSGAPDLDREGWKAYVELFRASFPDLHVDMEEMIATDDSVVMRTVLRGTHQEPFQGIPATGNEVAFTGVAIHHLENGQSVRHWGVLDLLSMMQQIGAIPGPEPAA